MKKVLWIVSALMALASLSQAEMKCAPGKCASGKCAGKVQVEKPKKMMKMFQSVSPSEATLLQSGDAKAFCPNCGMNLPMFYKTNHAATIDGKVKQYCSIHCLAEDITKGLKPTEIKVVDVSTLKFIDASKAHYVVGSRQKGTMTMTSKYAFADKAEAETFVKINGGEVTNFDGALQRAQQEFQNDTEMVDKKRVKMREMGKKLYTQKCQKTDQSFETVAEAKTFVVTNKLCEGLNPKQLQAVGLYLQSR
ncbi:nitrous oxide reductase accessory protein NosL [Sulfurovum mangrovi]|uniref:nitrous oxide reductase accessory protein NosL n=1 Tax=Sulfurovum mangrovi TaxID=2893889 RepID=UPI001E5A079F|nr:nitrous oxide reductase accessory protein NosL [Sulfurovum mangrovi]UFH59021.1 nitrous oxide reductase accessory protein NosL [Sulfurovum mangrovi]